MSQLDVSLRGRTAIVTGGTKNLGEQTIKELARFGANIVISYHSSSESEDAQRLIKELKGSFDVESIAIQGDLSQEDDAKRLFEETKQRFGGVDIAINNAGLLLKKRIGDVTTEEYDQMFDVNTKASFQFLKQCYSYLNEGGSIVLQVSSLLEAYCDGYGLYQGAKAPIEYFAKTASKELHSKRINVCCVGPGPMDTPLLHEQQRKKDVEFLESQGLGNRLTKVEDIVPIVRFLVTEGKWITGQTIYPSGGFTAH